MEDEIITPKDISQNVKSDNVITAKDMGIRHMSASNHPNAENAQEITIHGNAIRIQRNHRYMLIVKDLMKQRIIKNVQGIRRKRSIKH